MPYELQAEMLIDETAAKEKIYEFAKVDKIKNIIVFRNKMLKAA